MRSLILSLASCFLAAATLLSPRPAQACGGTFCDTGPQAMPVDQKGENILFVTEGSEVEAHIQIQYKGDAARFAWVLPVPALPKISVGSQPLFDAMLQTTVPRYGTRFVRECEQDGRGGMGGMASAASGGTGQGGGGPGGPAVVQKGTAGAFDYVVLQGGTGEEVVSWLGDNGYAQPESTATLLQHYLEKRYLFVAVKLTNGEGLDSIHPLVVRYEGNVPCVPLELTAVGALENMGVRTFFLGDKRWVPTNYKHVELNTLWLDWLRQGANYEDVLSRTIDSPVADGHAFVTEYAGTSSVVRLSNVYSSSWDSAKFTNIQPTSVVDELSVQGIAYCTPGFCQYNHPLIEGLLKTYLPKPAGLSDAQFYSCLGCYADKIDQLKWDATAFANDYEDRIVTPGKRASVVLAENAYLTRLYTTISPAEMTEDPEFVPVDGLPDVGSSHIATSFVGCSGRSSRVTMPIEHPGVAGRVVAIDWAGLWPSWGEEMPYAETITDFSGPGNAPNVLIDNTAKIDALLSTWNSSHGIGGAGAGSVSGVDDGPRGGAGGWAATGSDDLAVRPSGSEGGCSSSRGPEAQAGAGLLIAALLAARRARRR